MKVFTNRVFNSVRPSLREILEEEHQTTDTVSKLAKVCQKRCEYDEFLYSLDICSLLYPKRYHKKKEKSYNNSYKNLHHPHLIKQTNMCGAK